MEIKVIIHSNNGGSELMVKNKYGYLKGIQLTGENQQFNFAMAVIKDEQVVILGNKVHKPVVASFAWYNNPEDANLFKG